jgi:hypothetical protein
VKLSPKVSDALLALIVRMTAWRPADQIIGGSADPYMLRWWLTPWRKYDRTTSPHWWQRLAARLPKAYAHVFLRSDDDRALHDHPWANISILLCGEYTEHTISAGGIHHRIIRRPGDVVFRRAKAAHRIELHNGGDKLQRGVTGVAMRNVWSFPRYPSGYVRLS